MDQLQYNLKTIINDLYGIDVEPRVSVSDDERRGDYTSNAAMQIAKQVGKAPAEIAAEIAEKMSDMKVEVAGPGFLNFTYPDRLLLEELKSATEDFAGVFGYDKYAGKTVLTEFSDPNPFKVLHVGHLYTSLVGEAMSRLIEYAGGDVHRLNFGGDVGMHVAKAMYGMRQSMGGEFDYAKLLDGPLAERMDWIAKCYVEGTNAYDEDEAKKAEIIEINKQVFKITTEDLRDSETAKIYWTCREWSYEYFEEFYASVGVKFEKYYPESTVAVLGLETVKKHIGDVYTESDGAIVFVGEPYGLHTRVFINAAGIPTYEAKDVGLIMQKWADYHFDESIVITASDIIEYMKVVLKSVSMFEPELPKRTRHLTHGNVILPGGVKMSSRKGNFLRATDVLGEVAEVQKKINGETNQAVVLGAVKYAFLKSKVEPGTIVFDMEESVNLHGNSGPYLQYSLARAKSILRKLEDPSADIPADAELDKWEKALIRALLDWKYSVRRAVDELAPHRVCTYLYELAQTFSRFYENDKVVGGENEAVRRKIVEAYITVLEKGLDILGIPSVERI